MCEEFSPVSDPRSHVPAREITTRRNTQESSNFVLVEIEIKYRMLW